MKFIYFNLFALILFSCVSCHSTDKDIYAGSIPDPAKVVPLERLDELPSYFPSKISSFQVDLRAKDLTGLDLSSRSYDLEHSIFDNYTEWPDLDGTGFDPDRILSANLSPGMGLKKIHEQGITGKGVKIAIIDGPFINQHKEFNNPIEHIKSFPEDANDRNSFHGVYVASRIIGRSIGVAPDSEIFYYCVINNDINNNLSCENEILANITFSSSMTVGAAFPRRWQGYTPWSCRSTGQ